MRKPAERRGLIASFLVVYLAIVLLLAGLVTAGFHLYRTQVSRSEAGLQAAVAAVEIGPLLVTAFQQQDSQTTRRLMRSFFAFPAVQCVHFLQGGEKQSSWPERGCPTDMSAETTSFSLAIDDSDFALEFAIDHAYGKEQNWISTKAFAVLSVLVILLVAATFTFLLIKVILRPLMRLQHAMLTSTPDNPVFAEDLDAHQLGGAGLVYNQMAEQARSY